ncbi:MAG: cytochrome P460 family protein [Dehalococcoidia bacterium]|nr:cytochrome P460 family protein [Dehalococcoidia bacterium]
MSIAVSIAILSTGTAFSAQDKYAVKVKNGLAFSEFKGYESWETIFISQNARLLAVILGNPAMIEAYKASVPGNGKRFRDGAKMAKIHWNPKMNEEALPCITVSRIVCWSLAISSAITTH